MGCLFGILYKITLLLISLNTLLISNIGTGVQSSYVCPWTIVEFFSPTIFVSELLLQEKLELNYYVVTKDELLVLIFNRESHTKNQQVQKDVWNGT